MVTSVGTRNVISAADLISRVRGEESELLLARIEDALERLSQSRLVRSERRRDLYLYEITSEFLVPWITADAPSSGASKTATASTGGC